MANVTIKVVGERQFEAALKSMGDQAGGVLAAAVMAAAMVVTNEAKRLAPKKTRTLSRSIHAELVTKTATSAEATVGTNVEYARIHEFGGSIKHPGGTPYLFTGFARAGGVTFLKKDGKYPAGVRFTKPHVITMPARPYLRPALDTKKAEALRVMEKALRKLVKDGGP